MSILDDLTRIKELDESDMLASIDELAAQCQQTWEELEELEISPEYGQAKNIIVAGMGGSALGVEILKAVYADDLPVPLEIVRGYDLPAWADEDTLVVLSSYSGTTEEVLNIAGQVEKAGAMAMAITSGGALEEIARENGYPLFKIDPKHNPCDQPRMALGYAILGLVGMLAKSGLIDLDEAEVKVAISYLKNEKAKYTVDVEQAENPAKQIASRLHGRFPLVIAAEGLAGSAKAFCNQMNENAKNITTYYLVPELNHHLMEGLGFPRTNPDNLIFVLFESGLYSQRVQQRLAITRQVIEKNKVPVLSYQARGATKLTQTLEVLMVGSYVNFYLSMLNELNPSPIPWVDYFKSELKKLDAKS